MLSTKLLIATTAVFSVATALPNPPSGDTIVPTNNLSKRDDNKACGVHWSYQGETLSMDVKYPNGGGRIGTTTGSLDRGTSFCNDKFDGLCLTAVWNDEGNKKDNGIIRFGFGGDIWASSDTSRCEAKGRKYANVGLYSEEGDCSFSCTVK